MPVVTRSAALRRRNIVRKLTWVIRERMLADDTESDTDSESEHCPCPSDSETETETEVESETDTYTDSECVESEEDGESMRARVQRLRDELRVAEGMLRKWHAEEEAQMRENNNTCIPIILTAAITMGIWTWLEWSVLNKQMRWF